MKSLEYRMLVFKKKKMFCGAFYLSIRRLWVMSLCPGREGLDCKVTCLHAEQVAAPGGGVSHRVCTNAELHSRFH